MQESRLEMEQFGDGTEFTEHRRETVDSVWPKQHFSNLFDCDP